MREYQALFIIDADKEGTLKEVIVAITAAITKNNGKIDKSNELGKQRLPYRIKKKLEGIYYRLDFSVDPLQISALNNAYKLNTDILRVMITAKAKS